MATASSVVSRRGNDQFRGLFSDTWAVRATLDAGSLVDGAGETDDITIPGVALGDMVIGMSIGVSEAGLVRRAYISAANTVTVVTYNPTGGSVDIGGTTLQLIIGRAVV